MATFRLRRATGGSALRGDATLRGTDPQAFVRTAEDVAPATDVGTRLVAVARTSGDVSPATDVAVRTLALSRTTQDTSPATDVATRLAARSRTTTDVAPATDVGTRAFSGARATADLAPAIDAAVRALASQRATTDFAPATDVSSRVATRQRTVSDLAPATDTAVRSVANSRSARDVAGPPSGVTDSFGRADGPLGTADSGQQWRAIAGSGLHVVDGRLARGPVAGTQASVIDAGTPDCTVSFDYVVGASASSWYLRYTSALRHLRFDDEAGLLVEQNDGSQTVHAILSGGSVVAGDHIDIALSGSSVVVRRNGNVEISVSVGLLTGTEYGASTADATLRADNFTVVPATTADMGMRSVANARAVLDAAPSADEATRLLDAKRRTSDTALVSGGIGADTWSPALLPLDAWWDMSALGLANGAAVSTVNDTSGNLRHLTQLVASRQPAYRPTGLGDKGALQFNGGEIMSASTVPVGSPFTIVVVLSATILGNSIVYEQSTNTNQNMGSALANGVGATIGAKGSATLVPADAQFSAKDAAAGPNWLGTGAHVLIHSCDGTHAGHLLHRDGTPVALVNQPSGYVNDPGTLRSLTSFNLGARTGTTLVAPFSGLVAEVFIVSRVLTAIERADVNSYVQRKYGIAVADFRYDSATGGKGRTAAASDVATATDQAVRVVAATRPTADSAPAEDEAIRIMGLARSAADVAALSDVVMTIRGLVRLAQDLGGGTDAASRSVSAFRAGGDAAPATDSLGRLIAYLRSTADVATTDDAAQRVVAEGRVATDAVPVADAGTRHISAARSGGDAAGGADSLGQQVAQTRISDDAAPVEDTASRTLASQGVTGDAAPVEDAATRLVTIARDTDDTASLTDEAAAHAAHVRTADDVAAVLDSAERFGVVVRFAADGGEIADDASYHLDFLRSGFDTTTTTDEATLVKTRPPVFAPPVAIEFEIDKTKIGWKPGCDTAVVQFRFDQPVTAWQVRANSRGVYDGTLVASWTSAGGPGESAVLEGVAEVSAATLLVGTNDLAIYGRSVTGEWTLV